METGESAATIWTLGHSNRTVDALIALVESQGIDLVADVRRFPGSRRHPHFNRDALARTLGAVGIVYEWLGELGGRRRPRPDSPHTVWRNASFRGYADYMDTADFRAGIERLLTVARTRRTAILCAEALWWQCHRALIADYLESIGVRVLHILDAAQVEPHRYTAAARLVEGKLDY